MRCFASPVMAALSKDQIAVFSLMMVLMFWDRTNEFARQHPADPGAPSVFLAQLFDITFLMVCHIFQKYGMEVGGIAVCPQSMEVGGIDVCPHGMEVVLLLSVLTAWRLV